MSVELGCLSKTARYAMVATTSLARLDDGERIPSADLADRTGIPRAFLGKLMTQLSRVGLVDGLKGHGGGYRLARAADEIHLIDVIEAVEHSEAPRQCALGVDRCNPDHPCALHDQWMAVTQAMRDLLETTTVGEASRRERMVA